MNNGRPAILELQAAFVYIKTCAKSAIPKAID